MRMVQEEEEEEEDGPGGGGGGGWQYEDGLRVTFEEMHFSLEREMLE